MEDISQNSEAKTIITVQSFNIPINELKKLTVIGSGSSGLVEKAIHEPTKTVVALKVILYFYFQIIMIFSYKVNSIEYR